MNYIDVLQVRGLSAFQLGIISTGNSLSARISGTEAFTGKTSNATGTLNAKILTTSGLARQAETRASGISGLYNGLRTGATRLENPVTSGTQRYTGGAYYHRGAQNVYFNTHKFLGTVTFSTGTATFQSGVNLNGGVNVGGGLINFTSPTEATGSALTFSNGVAFTGRVDFSTGFVIQGLNSGNNGTEVGKLFQYGPFVCRATGTSNGVEPRPALGSYVAQHNIQRYTGTTADNVFHNTTTFAIMWPGSTGVLPLASSYSGRVLSIKRNTSLVGANTITIKAAGSDLIENRTGFGTRFNMTGIFEVRQLLSDGVSGWWRLDGYADNLANI